ncbi:cytoplasmic dynein 2 intermediate chain 2-like [Gigantopelta aegis]|uniref:cytoplasmic dynein 2 intermediate chain 2-like n=1 Tax=Gigantopelta aegis TaxID=1735272 RepID=UPI001B88BDD7|nr:cytoplasmic dynein 2 intermediate chain 2-like [Gigantopelta aegis]
MFADEVLEPVELKSYWKKERSLAETGIQTGNLRTQEVGCQSIKTFDEETQTENENEGFLRLAEDNSRHLAEFLARVEPMIVKTLVKNLRSHAFDGYVQHHDEASVTCIHTLTHSALEEQLQVTGLSWNATGSVIAATFGRFDHEDWCTHKAALGTWNLDRRTLDHNKPDTSIESSSCLMCLQFHPVNPAWIAGGSFNGEVLVWDLSREDDLVLATSGIGDDAHREPVAKVQWLLDPDSKTKRYNIISIGGDGKILIWSMNKKKQKLKLIEGFVLMAQSLPRSMKVRGVRSDKEVGATCISFNQEDKDTFVVGSESGCIFKCSLHAKGNPAGSHVISSVPLHSPVTFTFNPHHGPVYSVDCSPFHRLAFVSSGMDQCIRLYSMLQDRPVVTIEPGDGYLHSVQWSPFRPSVLATASANGSLLIYELLHGQLVPVHKLEASTKKSSLFTLKFNSQQRNLLSTGDGLGYIKIWKLGENLTTLMPRENEYLGNVINASTD